MFKTDAPPTAEALDDLTDRLTDARASLRGLVETAEQHGHNENRVRLAGKVEGVELALSYIGDYRRTNQV